MAWAKGLGADVIVDHKKGITASFKEQNLDKVDYAFNAFGDNLLPDVVPVIKPFGAVHGINGNVSEKEVPTIQSLFTRRIKFTQGQY